MSKQKIVTVTEWCTDDDAPRPWYESYRTLQGALDEVHRYLSDREIFEDELVSVEVHKGLLSDKPSETEWQVTATFDEAVLQFLLIATELQPL